MKRWCLAKGEGLDSKKPATVREIKSKRRLKSSRITNCYLRTENSAALHSGETPNELCRPLFHVTLWFGLPPRPRPEGGACLATYEPEPSAIGATVASRRPPSQWVSKSTPWPPQPTSVVQARGQFCKPPQITNPTGLLSGQKFLSKLSNMCFTRPPFSISNIGCLFYCTRPLCPHFFDARVFSPLMFLGLCFPVFFAFMEVTPWGSAKVLCCPSRGLGSGWGVGWGGVPGAGVAGGPGAAAGDEDQRPQRRPAVRHVPHRPGPRHAAVRGRAPPRRVIAPQPARPRPAVPPPYMKRRQSADWNTALTALHLSKGIDNLQWRVRIPLRPNLPLSFHESRSFVPRLCVIFFWPFEPSFPCLSA